MSSMGSAPAYGIVDGYIGTLVHQWESKGLSDGSLIEVRGARGASLLMFSPDAARGGDPASVVIAPVQGGSWPKDDGITLTIDQVAGFEMRRFPAQKQGTVATAVRSRLSSYLQDQINAWNTTFSSPLESTEDLLSSMANPEGLRAAIAKAVAPPGEGMSGRGNARLEAFTKEQRGLISKWLGVHDMNAAYARQQQTGTQRMAERASRGPSAATGRHTQEGEQAQKIFSGRLAFGSVGGRGRKRKTRRKRHKTRRRHTRARKSAKHRRRKTRTTRRRR